MILLVTGGSGSGKSRWAEKTISALSAEHLFYIATMEPFGREARERVARHRAQRADLGFETLELPRNAGSAGLPPGAAALLEDVPNLLANEMFGGGDWERVVPDIQKIARACRHLAIVTNDVFSDGVRYPDSTMTYIRRLARINAELARGADTVVEVVYSIPVAVKGALPCV